MNFARDLSFSIQVEVLVVSLIRLVLAAAMGGLIGWERSHTNRPAGLRTHVVVCIGAALIMILSEYMRLIYGNEVDLTRMGAQVISGIGFLGAGTIIKEGFNVKGLTTAASLWVVSCIGLALGSGFYSGAIIATLLIYFTLMIMKNILINHANTKMIILTVDSVDEVYLRVTDEFKRFKCNIYSTEITASSNGENKELSFVVSTPSEKEMLEVMLNRIKTLEGVKGQRYE